MLKSFYNPDEYEGLEYHKEIIKVVEQERLANEAVHINDAQSSPRHARFNLKELFRNLFSDKPDHSNLVCKEHK